MFKLSEDHSVNSFNSNYTIPNSKTIELPSNLPFMPHIQLNPEVISQMLIKKLSANNGLSSLNDL